MPFQFVVVCEAAADFQTATALAERVIREQVSWAEEHVLAGCPMWRGLESGQSFLGTVSSLIPCG